MSRNDCCEALRELVFAAKLGEVVGPVPFEERFGFAKVLERRPATLDEKTREAISATLFAEWLSERRGQASIEWFWGPTQPASAEGE